MQKADLIIIGAGPAGYEAAVEAARGGMSVVVIEAAKPGGTCLNEGCIPTKCFCRHAEVLDDVRSAALYGVSTGPAQLDMAAVVARKDEVVARLVSGVEGLLKTPGITYVQGRARFVGPHVVAVEESSEQFEASNIMIATGSVTKYLPIEGAHLPGVVSSRELLNLTQVPRRLCVVGGGVIGLEFAGIFHTFGSEVTVVEFCREILPNFDRDIAKRLRTSLKKRGIRFETQAAVTAITRDDDGQLRVAYDKGGKAGACEADCVLMAVGRAANTAGLGLDEAGIAYTRRGITVDEHYQTNVPGVYAVGDVNGLCQLAHAATFQALHVLHHIRGEQDAIRLDIVPAAVFTSPEVAMVGFTEETCKERGIACRVLKSFYRANGKALAMNADEGLVKLLTDENDRILGAHILGAHASDLIHEVVVMMNLGVPAGRLRDVVHAHPTLSELLLHLA